VNGLSTKL
jgi:hypothetical protein